MTVYSNYIVFDTPVTSTFTWPSGVENVWFKIWGAGASGGRSQYTQYAGAGASGAHGWGRASRPSSGSTLLVIGAGGASQTSTNAQGIHGADTHFGNCYAIADSAQGGQNAGSWHIGGDGGSGGVCSGPIINNGAVPIDGGFDGWIPGAMGGASAPVAVHDWNNQANGLPLWLNASHPSGAASPCGAGGGNNEQDGQSPGGGGAPGNIEFPSGRGGNGRVDVFW